MLELILVHSAFWDVHNVCQLTSLLVSHVLLAPSWQVHHIASYVLLDVPHALQVQLANLAPKAID